VLAAALAELGAPAESLVAAVHDRAAVNLTAIRIIQGGAFPDCWDIGCWSHTLNNVGSKMVVPELVELVNLFTAIFQNSPAARMAFRAHVGAPVKLTYATHLHSQSPSATRTLTHPPAHRYSRTRWFGWFDIAVGTIFKYWNSTLIFINNTDYTFAPQAMSAARAWAAVGGNMKWAHLQALVVARRLPGLYQAIYWVGA
jgi:hypothetical protein